MNKKFFLSWLAIFVVWMSGSFIIHGNLLHQDYTSLPQLFRNEVDSQQYFPLMLLAHLMMSGSVSWIYARGVANLPWLGQGLRFGLALACLNAIPWYTIYYVVQPMPGMLTVKQIVFDGILAVLLGLTAAFCYRQPAHA